MTFGLFKIVIYETKKTFLALILVGLIFVSLFSSINTLSTLSFSLMDSFCCSYGQTSFHLESTGLNDLDKINALNKGECILSLDGLSGYTEPSLTGSDDKPYFYRDSQIKAFTDVYHFSFSDNTSINIAKDKLNDYLDELKTKGVDSSQYRYYETTLSGKYSVFNSPFIVSLSKHFIEYNRAITDNSIFINDVIAKENRLKLNDSIKMATPKGNIVTKIAGIFDIKHLQLSFACNIKLLDEKVLSSFKQYSLHVTLANNANFMKNYDFFQSTFLKKQYSYDTRFLRLYNLVGTLRVTLVALLIFFLTIGVTITYLFTKLIVAKRKQMIYFLKLVGSRDHQIIFVYSFIFVPLVAMVSLCSCFLGNLFIQIIGAKTLNAIHWNFLSQFTFVSPLFLIAMVGVSFVLSFRALLNKNNRSMTYSLCRETL